MAKRRFKKQFKWILILLLIIIIGGIILIMKLDNEKENPQDKTTKTTTITTTTDKPVNTPDNYVETTPKGYMVTYENGAYYVDDYLIVNKSYALSDNFVPQNTQHKINNDICKTCIDKEGYKAYQDMLSDASAIGLNIYISSGYRSYSYQRGLYNNYIERDGQKAADTYSARAGHSEHQSGLSFDLNSITDAFAATNEGKWVNENCYLYGFIIRYPKGKDNETGYKYESWHLRYVGKELAKKLYNDGNWITMETYFGLESKYE